MDERMTTTTALDTHPTLAIAASRDGKVLVSPQRRRAGSRRLISPLILVLAWQAAATLGLLSPRTLASPVQILTTFWGLLASGELVWRLAVSLGRVAAGLAIGLCIATALALLSGLSRLGEDLVDAPVQMLRALSFLALVPLFILWFAIGETSKISTLLDAINAVAAWGRENPDALASTMADVTGVPLAVERVAAPRGVYAVQPMDDTIISQQQSIADTFAALRIIPSRIDIRSAVWRPALQRAEVSR
jgi:hypothetical protein